MLQKWIKDLAGTLAEDECVSRTLLYNIQSCMLRSYLFSKPNYFHFFFSFKLFYQLSTPRNNFLLNLTLQGGLLSRQFRVEYWKKGRLAWSHPYSPHCHYTGHLLDQPQSSKVALSNCNGLVRTQWFSKWGPAPPRWSGCIARWVFNITSYLRKLHWF